ncbi:MAG: iron ABC transporter permease [Ignisphaera sp.]
MALEIRKESINRFIFSITLSAVFLFVFFIFSLSVGTSMIPYSVVLYCLLKIECSKLTELLISYRFTRSTTAMLTGALLAISGTLMQSIARNPLAEPYILGLSSTALTALALTIVVNPTVIASRSLSMIITFLGALGGYFLTSTLSLLAGGTSYSLILSGIAVTATFSGFSHILLYIVQSKLRSPYHLLLMGTSATALTQDIYILLGILSIGLIVIYVLGLPKKLNAYVFGDTFAKQLGYNPKKLSLTTATLVSILTGSSVAVVGIVGFIGLAAPHIVGSSDHRVTIILSAILGATITVLADVGARVLAILTAQGEFPLGSVTSVIGAPFLAYLIIKGVKR